MEQEKAQDIALMRYTAIAPMLHGIPEGHKSLIAYCRHVSCTGVTTPTGELRNFSENTIRKWYDIYRAEGFDGLMPKERSDSGKTRVLDSDVQEKILLLKGTYPRITAVLVRDKLIDDGDISPDEVSQSTITRFLKKHACIGDGPDAPGMKRYERPHINEVWCGDSSVGPYMDVGEKKKKKVYIMALIDDASRYITGADVFFNDRFINVMEVMRSAVSKYGRPDLFNFDNGSPYRNKQMELLAARLGSVLHYDQPHCPTQKAKIERWYRTMKDRWMAALDMGSIHSLDELRGSLHAYVHSYNTAVHSSLKGQTPQERFFSEPERIKRFPENDIGKYFLLETERRVTADCVVTIDNTEYEVDSRFAKLKIKIRHTPDMNELYVEEADGSLSPLRILNKHENASVKRNKILLHKGEG